MERIKKSLLGKAAAILLIFALVLGMIPTEFVNVHAANEDDLTAPTVEATVSVSEWTKESVIINGTASDADSGVKAIYYQKGEEEKVAISTYDAETGAFSVEIPAQAYEGDYKILCEDNNGNFGEDVVSVKMDNVVPQITGVKADIENWTNNKVVISGTVEDALSGVASVTWEKESDGTTGAATYDAAKGTYNFEIAAQNYSGNYVITCADNAGNVSAKSTVAVKMDNEKCVVATCVADKTDWTSDKVVINGTVTDNLSGVASVTWKKESDGTTGSATLDVASGTYSFEVPAQSYQGNYIVTCKDNATNVSLESTVAVKMDNVAPVVSSAQADKKDWTNDKVVISGAVTDNLSGVASVTWKKESDGATGTATLDVANGTYSFEVPAQSYAGNYVITCVDNAGNVSAEVKVAVKMDSTAPGVDFARNIWKQIMYTVSFGLFYAKDQEMFIDSTDDLAGIKTIDRLEMNVKLNDKITLKTLEDSNLQWTNLYTVQEAGVKEDSNRKDNIVAANKNIIYCVKVTDFAGNVSYGTSDGMIFDVTDPVGALNENKMVLPSTATEAVTSAGRPLFNTTTVPFNVKVTEATIDGVLQSGIKTVSYELKAKDRATDAEYKATKSETWDAKDALKTEYETVITVDSNAFNYNYVDLTVTVVDNAGNEYAETYQFAIDITVPTIELSYDNNEVVGNYEGRGYFAAERTVTIVYTERAENWDQLQADQVLKETVAKKASNENVSYDVVWKDKDGETSDADTHTATIKFVDEVHYNVAEPAYTDEAGNIATLTVKDGTEYPYEFSIDVYDEDDTTAEISFKETTWLEKFLNTISFGALFTNEDVEVTVKAYDDFAGIKEVKYLEQKYKEGKQKVEVTADTVKTYTGWETAAIESDKDLEEVLTKTIEKADKNVVVYVWVVDYANHGRIWSSDGLIVDITKPAPALDGDKLVLPKTGKTGTTTTGRDLFNTDIVVFDVKATETTIDGVLQSGIKSISYTINAWDKKAQAEAGRIPDATKAETEIYSWTENTELVTSKEMTIEIVSDDFNYNYVELSVKVVDNAGNEYQETYPFAIDITKPKVTISYENNKPVHADEEQGYYDEERIATITYTERTENWDNWSEDAIKAIIKATDINGKNVNITKAYSVGEWEHNLGTISDDDTHTVKVTFKPTKVGGEDARYDITPSNYKDRAGNNALDTVVKENTNTQHAFKFTIDTVVPEVTDIEYLTEKIKFVEVLLEAITFGYYDRQVEVKVTVKDNMSDVIRLEYEGILDENVSTKNKPVLKNTVEGIDEDEKKTGNIVQSTENGKKDIFTMIFFIPESTLTEDNSFRGTVKVKAYDYCENSDNEKSEKHDVNNHIVIDKIAPVGQVTFDQPLKELNGISYYDKDFVATIKIDEANFYAEDVVVLVNDSPVVPTDWTQEGDVWTSHVTFTAENDYIMTVNYTDRSGNVMTEFKSNQKTLDKTVPVLNVSNIMHESANNQETIGFTLTVTDMNIAEDGIKPSVVAVVREGTSPNYTYANKTIALGTPALSTNANGQTVYTYTVSNLDIDGFYSLTCTAVDHANHSVANIAAAAKNNRGVEVETVNFSVNREGSVFWIETEHTNAKGEKKTNELNNAYVNGEVLVKIHELNVDKVDELEGADKNTVLTLNDGSESKTIELIDNAHGNGNYEKNVLRGTGGWYETIYTLNNDLFAKDGTYSLNIITYDMADNSNVNTKSEEGTIKFIVDRTKPVVTTNVKSGQIIDEDEYTIVFKIAEVNLDESTILVKVNGKEWEFEKVSDSTYQFKVKDLLNDQFTITVKDIAGNSSGNFTIEDLTVSTSWIIRWYANKPLFWGTIGGAVGVLGIFVLIILLKRRKKEEA